MKIKVGGEYILDSELLISFFEHTEENHKEDVLIYMGKYFLYTISKITGERTYEDAYIFYSEKKKSIMYSIQRKNFILDSEFDYNEKFVNFKENKIFVNNKSLKHFNKHGKNEKLHTVFMDEDDFLNNKERIDTAYNEH